MTFKTELLEHQVRAFEHIRGLKVAALFMDMGTGKTRTALEYLEEKRVTRGADLALWLCPVSTKENLQADIHKHCDMPVAYVEDYVDELICIVGLESISGSIRIFSRAKTIIERARKALLVVDESSLVKNPTAKRSRRALLLAQRAYYRIIMTGTPTPQGPWDLYMQMRLLDQRILGYSSWYAFAANHVEYSDKYPGMIVAAHNPRRITERISPYVFQVTKAECLDLPPKSYSTRHYSLSGTMYELYEQVREEFLRELEEVGLSDDCSGLSYVIFRYLGYLHRISSGWYDGVACPARARVLVEILEGIDTVRDKVVIWHRYMSDLVLLRAELPMAFVEFNGQTRGATRAEALAQFNAGVPIIICNIGCGAFGLNLQAANYAIYYNSTFDFARRCQSEDRVYRLGQTKNVHVIDIVSDSGIDRKINDCLCRKASMSRELREQIHAAQVQQDVSGLRGRMAEMTKLSRGRKRPGGGT